MRLPTLRKFWYNWLMITLILAAVLPVQVACTNCNGVGYFEVKCPRCSGKGVVKNSRHNYGSMNGVRADPFVPCANCLKGLSSKGKKGSGKVKVTCKVCKGLKKIKVKKP